MSQGWNVVLKARSGDEVPVGKIVDVPGGRAYHYWAKHGERRLDVDAWGLREAVLAHAEEHGAWRVLIYDKGEDVTYAIPLLDTAFFGTPGKTDKFGKTLNVPVERFVRISGKVPGVPFIPGQTRKVVAATDFWIREGRP